MGICVKFEEKNLPTRELSAAPDLNMVNELQEISVFQYNVCIAVTYLVIVHISPLYYIQVLFTFSFDLC